MKKVLQTRRLESSNDVFTWYHVSVFNVKIVVGSKHVAWDDGSVLTS